MLKKMFIIWIMGILVFSFTSIADDNHPPNKPILTGPSSGEAGKSYTYTAVSTDPDGDKIYYCFDWGDGEEFCSNMVNSGQEMKASHIWKDKGSYTIKVTATDEHGAESEPAALTVKMPYLLTADYHGKLRIYVVEPKSRWNDYEGKPYRFGFLDFAYNDDVYVSYGETKHINAVWDAAKSGYEGTKGNNIMAIATLFNSQPHDGYAYPPFKNKFNAYYVDACAAAEPGGEGINERINATHTVFAEMGTATYCSYCPIMLKALGDIYEEGEYPFYFVSMVSDKNSKAHERLINDYNIYGYPTAFFDGGRRVILGGISQKTVYEHAITYCLNQDVHDFNMSIKCNWKDGKLYVNVSIKNLEAEDDTPPVMEVEKPKNGYLYVFDKEIIPIPSQIPIIVGKITIIVNATDESGIEKVVFDVLHENMYNDTSPPYEYVYKGKLGKHTVKITAYDTFGNYFKKEIKMFCI